MEGILIVNYPTETYSRYWWDACTAPFVRQYDIFFSNQREIWGDIEKALGEYDEDSILEFCKPDEEFD